MSLFKICSRFQSIHLRNGIMVIPNRTCALAPYRAHEHSMIRNYEDSFQLWVLKKFKNDSKYATLSEKADFSFGNKSNVESLLDSLTKDKENQTLTPFKLRSLDGEFNSILSKTTSPVQLLRCLNVIMLTVPIQATKLKCFKNSIYQLEKLIKLNIATPHDIIQAMYYASQFKSSRLAQTFMAVALVKLDEKALNSLSVDDLGIFCLSLFRSSVPLKNPSILRALVDNFKNNVRSLIDEHPAAFVSFIKCFRISKFVDRELIALISAQNLNSLDTVAKIHLGVYFAVSNYPEVDFVAKYLISCVQQLSNRIDDRLYPRLKDFDNLLWSCGRFNISEVNESIVNSSIATYVKESLGMLKKDPHSQVALLLWLWICGCRLEEEVVRWVTLENAKSIAGFTHFKSVANLFLLLTCVHIESPNLLKPQIINLRDKRLQPNYEQYINKRPILKGWIKLISSEGSNLKLTDAQFSFQVPGLYIGGVSAVYEGKPISFEVIDDTVSLDNSTEMNGRMKLKLRLLEKLGHSIIQIPTNVPLDVLTLKKLLKEKFDISR